MGLFSIKKFEYSLEITNYLTIFLLFIFDKLKAFFTNISTFIEKIVVITIAERTI